MTNNAIRKHFLILPVLTLLTILLVACAPAAPSTFVPSVEPQQVNTLIPSLAPTDIPTVEQVIPTDLPSPILVATSRGPDLEATDPATVSLASGRLQLVEFFRFT